MFPKPPVAVDLQAVSTAALPASVVETTRRGDPRFPWGRNMSVRVAGDALFCLLTSLADCGLNSVQPRGSTGHF